MESMDLPDFRYPLAPGLLRLAGQTFGLGPAHQVLDLRTGNGAAALFLARTFGCQVTAIDEDESQIASSRRCADLCGLGNLVRFRALDVGRLPSSAFDVVLALGGALTAVDRVRGLEQIGVHLVPGGHLLLADLVYLDGPPPAAARDLLRDLTGPSGETVSVAENPPAPIVRAILEQGRYHFISEPQYLELLEAFGYRLLFDMLMPDSAWGEYFERASREAGSPDSPLFDPSARALVAQEAGAYYGYGGRGTVGYLFAGARYGEGDRE